MRIINWLFLLFFSKQYHICKSENYINFTNLVNSIHLLLQEITNPVKMTAMVCWDLDLSYKFHQYFNNENSTQLYYLRIASMDIRDFPFSEDEHQEMIIIDLNCKNNSYLLAQTKEELRYHYKWLIVDMSEKTKNTTMMNTEIMELLKDSPVLPRSEIFFIFPNEVGDYIINQVYRISRSTPLIIEVFGIVANNQLSDYRIIQNTSRRRRDLHGILLKASMVITHNNTLNHLNDYRDKEIDTISKVNYILTNHLMLYLNATIEYSIVDSWGYRNEVSNEWNGMIGDMIHNKADLGSTALFVTSERVPIIEYIAMPTKTISAFIFRAPKLSYTDNIYLLPFNNFLWFSLIGLIFIIAIFLIISTYIEWKLYSPVTSKTSDITTKPVLGDLIVLIFGAICQQGSSTIPKCLTGKIIIFLTFLILMFLYTSYSANIVALLQSPSTNIKTLQDLLNSRLKFGVDDTVFNRYYFTNEKEPIRKGIYEEKIKQKNGQENFIDIYEGVKLLRNGLYAFHMELGAGYKIIGETFFENEKCDLEEIEYLEVTDPWYSIHKNSSYKELFKTGMIRMYEHGLQDRENSLLYTKKPKCNGKNANFISASLIDTKPALLVLAWGYGITIIIFILELVIHHHRNRNIKRRKAKSKNKHSRIVFANNLNDKYQRRKHKF